MSRVGKQSIVIPAGTSVTVSGANVTVKGKGGEVTRSFRPYVGVMVEGSEIKLEPKGETRLARSLWGTYAAHIRNMIAGVNTPFVVKLIIEGVGFKANVVGTKIQLALGFSHPVEIEIPKGVTVTADKGLLTITGIDRDQVSQFAANIRALKKPEPYKGKGIRYEKEVIHRKQGKKAVG